jgi:hypothetical protein
MMRISGLDKEKKKCVQNYEKKFLVGDNLETCQEMRRNAVT